METMFWIWMAAAGVFLIIELMTPTMIFICFVVGAIAAALLAQLWPESYYWQVAMFAILSALLIPFTNVDRMIGQVALVTQAIDPDLGGKIQFEGEVWVARADTAIAENTKVKINTVAGTKVMVERLD